MVTVVVVGAGVDRPTATGPLASTLEETRQAHRRIRYETLTNESDLSDVEFWATQYPYLERAMWRSGRYPAMAVLRPDTFDLGWDETFDFGLARLLDGVAALVESRRPPN